MASYLEGATLLSLGISIVLFQHAFHLSAWSQGALSALLLFTFAGGAIIGGRLGDLFGRRKVYSVDLLIYMAGTVIVMCASSQPLLFLGVTVTGLAMGADLPTSLALVAEEAPPGKQGSAMAYSQTLLLAGVGVAQILTLFLGSKGATGARFLFLHLFIVALIVWVLRRRVAESIVWEQTRKSDDRTELRRLRRVFGKPYGAALLATGLYFVISGLMPNALSQFGAYLFVTIAHTGASTYSLLGLPSLVLGPAIAIGLQRYVDTRYRVWFVAIGLGSLIAGPLVAVAGRFSLPSLVGLVILNTIGATWAGDGIYRVWTQEIFPTEMRSTAQGFTYGLARLLMAAFSLVTPALIAHSATELMLVLSGLGVMGSIIGLTLIPRIPRHGRLDSPRPQPAAAADVRTAVHVS